MRATVLVVPAGTTRTVSPTRDRAADDLAAEAAEVEVGPVDPLDRHAERAAAAVVVDLDRLEVPHERRPVVPGRVRARGDDVVALERGHGDGRELAQADALGERAVVGDDLVEDLLRVVHEVELVDRQDDAADPEQADQEAVPPGLGEHSLAGVDEDHRGVGGGRARDHVARVLLVAGGVRDDELARLGGEEPVGDVDGDALLALGTEPVHEQREVQVVALRADLLGVDLERGEVVLEDHVRLVEQPSDERALAVVDAAARDEAQQALVLVGEQVGVDVFCDEVRGVCHLEVALLLLLLHGPRGVVVDDTALPFGGRRRGASPG